jgi:NADH:ubiquinone oxidoreductase subunit 4 (subunit M)
MLAMYSGQIGLFSSRDLLLFIYYHVGVKINFCLLTFIHVWLE